MLAATRPWLAGVICQASVLLRFLDRDWSGDMDMVDCLDWDSNKVLGQNFLYAMVSLTAVAGSKMFWTPTEWENDDHILILFLFFSFLFISTFQEKKKAKLSDSGTVTFLLV